MYFQFTELYNVSFSFSYDFSISRNALPAYACVLYMILLYIDTYPEVPWGRWKSNAKDDKKKGKKLQKCVSFLEHLMNFIFCSKITNNNDKKKVKWNSSNQEKNLQMFSKEREHKKIQNSVSDIPESSSFFSFVDVDMPVPEFKAK